MSKNKTTIILTHIETGTKEPWTALSKLLKAHPEISKIGIYDKKFPFERNGYLFEKLDNNVVREKLTRPATKADIAQIAERIIADAIFMAKWYGISKDECLKPIEGCTFDNPNSKL